MALLSELWLYPPYSDLFLLCPPHSFSLQARDAAARGDLEGARRSGQMALGLNIAAVVFYIIIWALIIGLAAGVGSTTRCYYSYSGYYICY